MADESPTPEPQDPAKSPPEPGNGHSGDSHPMEGKTPQAGKVCGAQLRGKPGKFCQKPPVPGATRCNLHGGYSHAGGPGHPTATRGGFYSKLLPRGLRKTYNKVLGDPETLNAREEVALLRLRVGQLASKLDTGEPAQTWTELQGTFGELTAAIRAGNDELFKSSLDKLGALIKKGVDQEAIWAELTEAIESKTTVAAREHKRMVDMQQLITAEKALALINSIMHSVVRNVPDLQARIRISHDVRALINRGEDDEG